MSTVDPQEWSFVNGLQTEFQPEIMITGITLQEIQKVVGHAIGTGPCRKADDLLLGKDLINRVQLLARRIGIGEGLETDKDFPLGGLWKKTATVFSRTETKASLWSINPSGNSG